MIQFITLTATDCFSYEKLEFDFRTGLHSISGSNGSSKTSVFMTLQQCLFNKNSKGCKVDDVNNKVTGKPYEIELTMDKDGVVYTILNSKKQGIIKITRDGSNISLKRIPDNLKMIQEILGTDFDGFENLTYQSKSSTMDLLDSSTNTGRSAFANKVLKLSEIDGHLSRMVEFKKELEGKTGRIAFLEKSIENKVSSLGQLSEEKELIDTLKDERRLQDLSELLDGIVQKKALLESTLRNLEADLKKSLNYADQMKLKQRKEQQLKELVEPDKDLVECRDQLQKITTAHATRLAKIKTLEADIATMDKANRLGKCFTCNHGVAEGYFDEQIAAIKAEVISHKEFVAKCVEGKAKYEGRIATWTTINNLKTDIDKLASAAPYVDITDEALSASIEDTKEKLSETYELHDTLKESRGQTLKTLNSAKEHNAMVRAVKELNVKIAENNGRLSLQIDSETKELMKCEHRLELIKTWIGILGPKGYRTAKIKTFLQALNSTMLKYSKLICNGRIQCNFFINESGEIDFSITDEAKVMDMALWSGGESSRIKLVCLFAVLELLEVMGSTSFNVLCLDEVFSTLDAEGKEGLFKVLAYLKGKSKAIYVIAHEDLALDLVYDSVIKAEKLPNGTTRISQ